LKTVFPHLTTIIALTITLLACTTKVESVALDKSILTIAVGDREALKATIQPQNATDQAVTWDIDNKDFASISTDGTVTAKSPGKATITVTTRNGGHTATCTLTTIPNVSLDAKVITLNVGDTKTLLASTRPESAVESGFEWSSSNNAVATVNDKGVTRAVGQGSTTIAVTALDGGKTASCNLTVVQPVKNVSLDRNAWTLERGNSRTLNARINPANATNQKLTWSSSDTSVARVSNDGQIEAISKGKATITVTTDDGNKTAKCSLSVVLSDEQWIGLVERISKETFQYFVYEYTALKYLVLPGSKALYDLDAYGSKYVTTMDSMIRAFRMGYINRSQIIYYYEEYAKAYSTLADVYRGDSTLSAIYARLANKFRTILSEIR